MKAVENRAKLLGLLGLAQRAGKLALGSRAVTNLVRKGRLPLVIVARDVGLAQRRKWLKLEPVRGFLVDIVSRDELARALGRKQLAVVAIDDKGFVDGIKKLGLRSDIENSRAGQRVARESGNSQSCTPQSRVRKPR